MPNKQATLLPKYSEESNPNSKHPVSLTWTQKFHSNSPYLPLQLISAHSLPTHSAPANLVFFLCLKHIQFVPWGVFFFFNKYIYFNWRLITLQYCSSFCHKSTWISHRRTCVPHPEPPLTSLPIPPPRVIPVHQPWAPCLMHWAWTGDLLYIW